MSTETSGYYYPPIPPEAFPPVVTMLRLLAQNGDEYLEQSPYPPILVQFFASMQVGPKGGSDLIINSDQDKWIILEKEARSLFNELKVTKDRFKPEDVTEQMQYFRTAASLLEKLIGLQERAIGLKQMSDFQAGIIKFMDEILTPDQRTIFMERLESIQDSNGGKVGNEKSKSVVEVAGEDQPSA